VNSTVIKVVDSTAAVTSETGHTKFRAWYASTWVGVGDIGVRVTQLNTDLQKHPLFFKIDQTATNQSAYATDAYVPFGSGRLPATNMGGTGDRPDIGPFPLWQVQFLQSGDYRTANAVEQSTLSVLSYNINYRHSTTGLVPGRAEMIGKYQNGFGSNWPITGNASDALCWEIAHHPASGLMGFVVRPSPVFIEIAQKVCVCNATYNADPGMLTYGWSSTAYGISDMTGIFGPSCQIRGKAWSIRSLSHATFLSLDGSSWKTGGRTWLGNNAKYFKAFMDNSKSHLNVIWNDAPDAPQDDNGYGFGIVVAMWMYHFLVGELHRAASVKPLNVATDQTILDNAADYAALQPVRWVNEQSDGGWRYAEQYRTVISTAVTTNTIVQPLTWTDMQVYRFGTTHPTTVSGTWMQGGSGSERTYAALDAQGAITVVGGNYTTQFWSALIAAVERGVAGAQVAYNTVLANVTNLTTWKASGAGDPRWLAAPRANVPVVGFGVGAAAGSLVGNVWTPGVDSTGRVNQVSWNLVPIGQWVQVAGSRLDDLDAVVKARIPGWTGYGGAGPTGSNWDGVMVSWSSFAQDTDGSRHWIFGGGHSNSYNNGLYRFDMFKMKWDVECLPTDPTVISGKTAYYAQNSSTYYGPSTTAAIAKRTAGTLGVVNDIWWDELDDGKPTARHTYNSLAYSKSLNKIIMCCRRLWTFDLAAQKWDYKRLINDYISTGDMVNDMALAAEGIRMAWDETRQRLWVLASGSSGNNNQFSFDFNATNAAGIKGKWAAASFPWYGAGEQAVCLKDINTYVTMKTPSNPSRPYSGRGEYMGFDLTTGAELAGYRGTGGAALQPQLTTGLAMTDFDGSDDHEGIVYVPPINRYWLWGNFAASPKYRCVELDPTTTPWTMSNKTFAGTYTPDIGATGVALLGGKVLYYPQLNCVILNDAASRFANIYRFA
jgi:hypothetical protein